MQADKVSGDLRNARAVVISGHATCFEASGIIGAATEWKALSDNLKDIRSISFVFCS